MATYTIRQSLPDLLKNLPTKNPRTQTRFAATNLSGTREPSLDDRACILIFHYDSPQPQDAQIGLMMTDRRGTLVHLDGQAGNQPPYRGDYRMFTKALRDLGARRVY